MLKLSDSYSLSFTAPLINSGGMLVWANPCISVIALLVRVVQRRKGDSQVKPENDNCQVIASFSNYKVFPRRIAQFRLHEIPCRELEGGAIFL